MIHLRPMKNSDTIAAIATPPGDGGVAIIRISGSEALKVAGRIFARDVEKFKSHTAHFGRILDCNGDPIDEVLLLPMRGPHSFTGEDVVEIHCHGGRLITQRVLNATLAAGAHPAGPGAFSERAFLNGKIDLTQAEAIQQLIAAKNEEALKAARHHLAGDLSEKITAFQRTLTEITAIIEAWVDYPEEGLEFATTDEIIDQLSTISQSMNALSDTFHDGKIFTEGLSLCLLGAPNVGKSSLMNALLGKDRAIVTHIAGTTRDLLEEPLRIGPLHYNLIDTAGIRNTEEIIEREGIARTRKSAMEADIILCVLDSSRPLTDEEEALLASLPSDKTLVVHNKSDLPQEEHNPLDFPHQIHLSALKKEGIDALKETITSAFAPSPAPITLTNERHHHALNEAISSVETVIVGLKSEISPELLVVDLRGALHALASILGTDVTEDILSAIFSKFCVGK